MNFKKLIKRTVIGLLTTAVVVGGAGAGIHYYRQNNNRAVELVPVAALNSAEWVHWEDDEGAYGTVRSDVSQRVTVPGDMYVEDVFVNEGDEVKVGDKLMVYDTTLLELDQELQSLIVQRQELELEAARKDLEKLRNTTPVGHSRDDAYDDYSYGDDDDDDPFDFLEASNARMVANDRAMMATTDEQEEPAGDTEKKEEKKEEKKKQDDTEKQEPVTEKPEPVTEAPVVVPETEAPAEPVTEAPVVIPETEKETEKPQAPETEKKPDKENNQQETQEDVWNLEKDKEEPGVPVKTEKEKMKELKELQNLSLKDFLNNIRIKSVIDQEETLLLDTIVQRDYYEVEIDSDLKLNPHFRESGEHHFEEKGTYALSIYGLKLKQPIVGKVYGIAAINGMDYPEIGGYTLVMDPNKEKTAILTIAFHDGLTKEHEVDPALEDMYTEIPLKKEEICKGTLTFIVSDQESDWRKIEIVKEEEETETETESEIHTEAPSETTSEAIADIEQVDASESEFMSEPWSEFESESESESETETEAVGESESESESESEAMSELELMTETESESETETETESEVQIQQREAGFRVKWFHGTNSELRWPDALKLFFYEEGAEDAQWSVTLSEDTNKIHIDGAAGIEGEDFPDGVQEETEEDSSEETESETQEEEQVEVIPDEDNFSEETWRMIYLTWPGGSAFPPYQEGSVWAYAENYKGTVATKTDEQGNSYYEVIMTYQEPTDSPLLVVDPIQELKFEHGANTIAGNGIRAYKGSGTATDPYVFLVADGVKIDNTFVNWAMGFDADGINRVGEGYVVKLEIRDGDTLSGVFLRSIELNGKIPAESGYGPGTYWIFDSQTGLTKYEEEVPDPTPDYPDFPDFPDDPWYGDEGESYTYEELEAAIKEKELEIRKLELDQKEANLKLKQYNDQIKNSTVLSAVDGVVANLGGDGFSDAYMVVNSKNGLYIKTQIGELDLDSIEVGDTIRCHSWSSGGQFNATITKIDNVPSNDNDFYSYNSNPNSSNYPVIAVVEEGTELEEYDYVQVKFTTKKKKYSDIYLEKPYIRSENGKSYVYIRGEDNTLKKQYVKTGETVYNSIEIKAGLKKSDYIAFPYGKIVKEGAQTKIGGGYDDVLEYE